MVRLHVVLVELVGALGQMRQRPVQLMTADLLCRELACLSKTDSQSVLNGKLKFSTDFDGDSR